MTPPQKRNKENQGLPKGWRFRHGAYYLRIDGKDVRLGKTESEAHRAYALMIMPSVNVTTMAELFDRYQLEELPKKKPHTQKSNLYSLKRLRIVFAHNQVSAIKSQHCYQYRDNCEKKHGKKSTNCDLEVLSHAFSKAIEWGVIGNDQHPMRGLKMKFGIKDGLKPRTRYVTDAELEQALTQASPFLKAYIELKLATGMSKCDLLSIKLTDIKEDGLHYSRIKTDGKPKVYPFNVDGVDTGLRDKIDACLAIRSKVKSFYLFNTQEGQPYIKSDGMTSGFNSIWQRFMKKFMANTDVATKFTEHDLRAKVASDAEEAHAKELMSHANQSTTNRIYRRKPDVVLPIKR